MATPEFVVVYDILEQGLETFQFLLLLGILSGVVAGCYNIIKTLRQGQHDWVNVCGLLVFLICLVIWISLVGNFVSGILWQQWRCMSWAKKGDFQVAEGHVQGYRRTKLTKWTARESFTVNGVHFFLSDSDWLKAGFNKTSWRGGPFRGGVYARISHKDGYLLKVETVE